MRAAAGALLALAACSIPNDTFVVGDGRSGSDGSGASADAAPLVGADAYALTGSGAIVHLKQDSSGKLVAHDRVVPPSVTLDTAVAYQGTNPAQPSEALFVAVENGSATQIYDYIVGSDGSLIDPPEIVPLNLSCGASRPHLVIDHPHQALAVGCNGTIDDLPIDGSAMLGSASPSWLLPSGDGSLTDLALNADSSCAFAANNAGLFDDQLGSNGRGGGAVQDNNNGSPWILAAGSSTVFAYDAAGATLDEYGDLFSGCALSLSASAPLSATMARPAIDASGGYLVAASGQNLVSFEIAGNNTVTAAGSLGVGALLAVVLAPSAPRNFYAVNGVTGNGSIIAFQVSAANGAISSLASPLTGLASGDAVVWLTFPE